MSLPVPQPDNKPKPVYANSSSRQRFLMAYKRGMFPVFSREGLKCTEEVMLSFFIRLSERTFNPKRQNGKFRLEKAQEGWYMSTADFVRKYLGITYDQQKTVIKNLEKKGLIKVAVIRKPSFVRVYPGYRYVQLTLPEITQPQTPPKILEWKTQQIQKGSWWFFRPKLATLLWPETHETQEMRGKPIPFIQNVILQCLYDQSRAHSDQDERQACWSTTYLKQKLKLDKFQQWYHLKPLRTAGLITLVENPLAKGRAARSIQFNTKVLSRCLPNFNDVKLWEKRDT